MNREKLIEELKNCSTDDLKLIYTTQKDLYSPEEMAVIKELILSKNNGNQEEISGSRLPKTITCPKCDGMNQFTNEYCRYCGHKLDKSKYIDYYNNAADNFSYVENEDRQSHAFEYVMSFLIPLVGFILGSILLSKDDASDKSVGKACIIIAFISNLLTIIIPLGTILLPLLFK